MSEPLRLLPLRILLGWMPGIDLKRIGEFEEGFIPQALDLFGWTMPSSDKEASLLARLNAKFRTGVA